MFKIHLKCTNENPEFKQLSLFTCNERGLKAIL